MNLLAIAALPAVALLPATLPGGHAVAGDFDLNVALASDRVEHGVSRSQGDPSLQARAGLRFGEGWWAGASFTTMNLNPGPGPNREVGVYIGRGGELGRGWSWSADAARYFFSAQIPRLPYDYAELRLAAAWRGRVELALTVSPDYSVGTRLGVARNAVSVDAQLNVVQPLSPWLQLSAGVGHFDVDDRAPLGFWYWGASAILGGPRLSLALTWTGSEHATRNMFGPRGTGERLLATLSWRVH
ncbi:MAG: TorF family putative porin [Steroidobacteraceae bacterium]